MMFDWQKPARRCKRALVCTFGQLTKTTNLASCSSTGQINSQSNSYVGIVRGVIGKDPVKIVRGRLVSVSHILAGRKSWHLLAIFPTKKNVYSSFIFTTFESTIHLT